MKLRLLPILLSLVISSAVLFGGWFAYRSVAMEHPLLEIVRNTDGVERVQMDFGNDKITLRLRLSSDSNLREIVRHIQTEGSEMIGGRTLDIQVTNESSPELEKWWSGALFAVAEAMETKRYSLIPEALNRAAAKENGISAETEMDEKHIYIRLSKGDDIKFVILPKTPALMEVWADE